MLKKNNTNLYKRTTKNKNYKKRDKYKINHIKFKAIEKLLILILLSFLFFLVKNNSSVRKINNNYVNEIKNFQKLRNSSFNYNKQKLIYNA